MAVLKLLLFPFSLLYKIITDFRNHLYDTGRRRSFIFDRVVISVGNLTVGGTGKTPFVELLVRQLHSGFNIAILSRGYGRKTYGFRLAKEEDDAQTLGDEPYQYFKKFGHHVTVAVGEKRALAIPEILFEKERTELIILDDAYQHRSVKPHINILLSDFQRPFYDDLLMPAGRLRESRKNAERADMVVVTKCPGQLEEETMEKMEKKIRKYTGEHIPIYFTGIRYLDPISADGHAPGSTNFFVFTGIANPSPLMDYVQSQFTLLGQRAFPDHYNYTSQDLNGLINTLQEHKISESSLLTTEKDIMRILSTNPQFLSSNPVFYLPIELYFLKNEDCFAKNLASMIDKSILQINGE